MINNRQQGGRRRGRGGQRTQGQGQSGPSGNRQDNRQRGNAAQLLEKYKSMARDSQLAGDRVQTEYFLQFADHYFRVLGESRSRFEDQRRQRGDDDLDDDDGEEEMGESDGAEAQDDRSSRPQGRDRPRRSEVDDQPRHRPRERDEQQAESRNENRPEDKNETRDEERDERPVRRKRPNGSGETLPLSALPPAIGRSDETGGDEPVDESKDEAPKPRRRARPARPTDGDEKIVPVG